MDPKDTNYGATPQSKVTAEVSPSAPSLCSQTGGRENDIHETQARSFICRGTWVPLQ